MTYFSGPQIDELVSGWIIGEKGPASKLLGGNLDLNHHRCKKASRPADSSLDQVQQNLFVLLYLKFS